MNFKKKFMSGLNYGKSYIHKRGMYVNKKVGVSYVESIQQWVVRILKKGTVTTLAKFKNKEDADNYYNSLNN